MAQRTIRKQLLAVTRDWSEEERKQLLDYAERLAKRSGKETEKGMGKNAPRESLSENDGRPSYLALSNPGEYEFQKKHADNPQL